MSVCFLYNNSEHLLALNNLTLARLFPSEWHEWYHRVNWAYMCFSPDLKSWATNRTRVLSSFPWLLSWLFFQRVMEIPAALPFRDSMKCSCASESCLRMLYELQRTSKVATDPPSGSLEISLGNCPAKLSPLKTVLYGVHLIAGANRKEQAENWP